MAAWKLVSADGQSGGERLRGEDRPAVGIPVVRAERSVGDTVPAPRRATVDADELEIPSFLRRK